MSLFEAFISSCVVGLPAYILDSMPCRFEKETTLLTLLMEGVKFSIDGLEGSSAQLPLPTGGVDFLEGMHEGDYFSGVE